MRKDSAKTGVRRLYFPVAKRPHVPESPLAKMPDDAGGDILPMQFYERSSINTGPRLLLACLIREAIDSYLATRKASPYRELRSRHDNAKAWFLSSSNEPFTFAWACENLGISAPDIREKILSADRPLRTGRNYN